MHARTTHKHTQTHTCTPVYEKRRQHTMQVPPLHVVLVPAAAQRDSVTSPPPPARPPRPLARRRHRHIAAHTPAVLQRSTMSCNARRSREPVVAHGLGAARVGDVHAREARVHGQRRVHLPLAEPRERAEDQVLRLQRAQALRGRRGAASPSYCECGVARIAKCRRGATAIARRQQLLQIVRRRRTLNMGTEIVSHSGLLRRDALAPPSMHTPSTRKPAMKSSCRHIRINAINSTTLLRVPTNRANNISLAVAAYGMVWGLPRCARTCFRVRCPTSYTRRTHVRPSFSLACAAEEAGILI